MQYAKPFIKMVDINNSNNADVIRVYDDAFGIQYVPRFFLMEQRDDGTHMLMDDERKGSNSLIRMVNYVMKNQKTM